MISGFGEFWKYSLGHPYGQGWGEEGDKLPQCKDDDKNKEVQLLLPLHKLNEPGVYSGACK